MRSHIAPTLMLALIGFVSEGKANAENVIAPYSGKLFLKCVGGSAGATSQFGLGTSPADFVPYLINLPSSCPTAEVSAGTVSAGQAVSFGIRTTWSGQTYWAFTSGTDQASKVAFGTKGGSVINIIEQTSSSTWVMHLDDAASYLVNDNDADILIQLRLDGSPTQVLPQFAFGGGWYSALYFTNMGSSAVSFPVNFVGDNGAPMIVPSAGGSSVTVNLATRGTVMIEAPNAGPLTQGYAAMVLPDGVSGYGVFRLSSPGRADQEAVVPLAGVASATSTLTWDDTGFTTAAAIVNLSSSSSTIVVTARDSLGTIIGTSSVILPANGKTAVALRDLPGLGAMAGSRGSADFNALTGNVAVLGLRFDGAAFTSIPTVQR